MLVAGLVLVLLALVLFVVVLFGGDGHSVGLDLGLLGNWNVGPVALFLLGAVAMLVFFIGLGAMRVGARRARDHRKDRKKVDELSRKLDEAKRERAEEEHHDVDRPPATP